MGKNIRHWDEPVKRTSMKLQFTAVLFVALSVLSLKAKEINDVLPFHQRIQHTNVGSWLTNKYLFGTLATKYESFDLGRTNNWHPNFYNIVPVKEQFRMIQEEVCWSKETNWVKAGLLLQYSPNTNRTDVAFYFLLSNGYTNDLPDETRGYYPHGMHGIEMIFWLPPLEQCYQISLRDENGSLVPKTKWGERFSKPVAAKFNRFRDSKYQRCSLDTNPSITVIPSPLLLRDCFQITNSGRYYLEVEICVLKETKSNPPYEECHFPVNVQVEIKNP